MKASQLSPIKLPSLELAREEAPTRAYTSHYGAHPDINFLLFLLHVFLLSLFLSLSLALLSQTNNQRHKLKAHGFPPNNRLRKFGAGDLGEIWGLCGCPLGRKEVCFSWLIVSFLVLHEGLSVPTGNRQWILVSVTPTHTQLLPSRDLETDWTEISSGNLHVDGDYSSLRLGFYHLFVSSGLPDPLRIPAAWNQRTSSAREPLHVFDASWTVSSSRLCSVRSVKTERPGEVWCL